MRVTGTFFLAIVATCLLASGSLAEEPKERPITKVVKLLKDMKAQLEEEAVADEDTYNKLACWCETNEKEKRAAIAFNEQKVEQLTSTIAELTATSKALQVKIDSTHDDLQKNNGGKTQSREIRMKEEQEFHAEETDLIQAIRSLEGAVTALSKHNEAGLVQQKSKLQALVKQHKNMLATVVSAENLQALNSFLSGSTELVQTESHLRRANQPAVMSSYANRSGQIYGILNQMKKTFEQNLEELRKDEMARVESYKSLLSTKETEIAANKKALAEAEANKAQTDEDNVAAKKDLEQTKEVLEEDKAFLANLLETCKQTDAEYEQRKADRAAEVIAVNDTIQILNNDAAFENFGKTFSFLQMSSHSRSATLKSKALALLRSKAQVLKSTHLATFTQQLALDAFTKVKQSIDDMITELSKQNQDEIKERDVCVADFAENTRATAVNEDERSDLSTKIDSLKQSIKTLTTDLKMLEQENADMKTQMKRAGDDRAAENAEFQQTIFDQRATQEILKRAMARMELVYRERARAAADKQRAEATEGLALVQYTPLTGDAPAKFTEYNQHKGGNRVVTMLVEVIAEAKKTEADAVKSETDAQAAYEVMVKDSNSAIATKMEQIATKTAEHARDSEALAIATDDLHATVATLERLSKELGDIHGQCDYLMKNFDTRQSSRTNEVEALRQAKDILSGMK